MEVVIKKTIAWLSLLVIVLYVITGYGMTKSETITKLSFGLLDKSISRTIHFSLMIPLILLLVAHVLLACGILQSLRKDEVCKK